VKKLFSFETSQFCNDFIFANDKHTKNISEKSIPFGISQFCNDFISVNDEH